MRKRPMPTGRQEGRRIHARARLEIVPFVKLTPEIVPTSTPEGLEYALIRDALPTVSRYAWSRHGSGRDPETRKPTAISAITPRITAWRAGSHVSGGTVTCSGGSSSAAGSGRATAGESTPRAVPSW